MAEVQLVEVRELFKSQIICSMPWEAKTDSFPFYLSICGCLLTSRKNPTDLCSETLPPVGRNFWRVRLLGLRSVSLP